jgi:hypothetical protein
MPNTNQKRKSGKKALMTPSKCLSRPAMHDIRDVKGKVQFWCREGGLCKTKVLASGGDGREDLLTEYLVAFVFGKIKL